jgi:hypothetical protein
VTSVDDILISDMDRVNHEIGESIRPIHEEVVWMARIVQDRRNALYPFFTKITAKFSGFEELFCAMFMTKRGTAWRSIELREGVNSVL